MPDPNHYLVRTEEKFVEKNRVAIGWSDHSFAGCQDAEDAIRQISASYDIGKRANQIRRFFNMKEGDLVIVPLARSIAIGVVAGGLAFDAAAVASDRANQRAVIFDRTPDGALRKYSRDLLVESLQRRLRVQGMTVNDLNEFSDEILRVRGCVTASDSPITLRMAEAEEANAKQLKKQLLENIQGGQTYLRAGGLGLEDLVKELLEVDGYSARILAKNATKSGTDADIEGVLIPRFSQDAVKVLVQVKHHQGQTGAWGVQQLQALRSAYAVQYKDHDLVLVTSAKIAPDARKKADESEFPITLVDGEGLADWVVENLDSLCKETRQKLGICSQYALVI